MKKIGFLINPIAGLGGTVGLKGTDNKANLALELGAIPRAQERAKEALKQICKDNTSFRFFTCSDYMGENVLRSLSIPFDVIYNKENEKSTKTDTINALNLMIKENIDLIIFAGGDGTARDVYCVINLTIPVIGIPAGVKIHSPIYSKNPTKAGELLNSFILNKISIFKEMEVVDIDEKSYLEDRVTTSLYGYLKIPFIKNYNQNRKVPSPVSEKSAQKLIAYDVIDSFEKDIYYIIGPGTTTRAVLEELNLQYTLLGIDIVKNKILIKKDATESDILNIINSSKAKLVLTPTGNQGYLFGRGNQQISPKVIRKIGKNNIIVLATKDKLSQLSGQPLWVDTYDSKLNNELSGYIRITVGYKETAIYQIKG